MRCKCLLHFNKKYNQNVIYLMGLLMDSELRSGFLGTCRKKFEYFSNNDYNDMKN